MTALPIEAVLPEIVEAARRAPVVVLEAEPGAGKTTRVPLALLTSGVAADRSIVVLEPRRLAARLAARYVAHLARERLGERVGYQVRYEDVRGPRTRLVFMTEALLLRRLLDDPHLRDIGVVVFDEFHERHLASDLAFALVRRLQSTSRPDLKAIVMSATLETAVVTRGLGDAALIQVSGRQHPVTVSHLERPDDRPLATQVAAAVRRLTTGKSDGDVLVFLPGAAEIRRAQAACEEFARNRDLLVVPLHGDLPPAEQDRAVGPADRRKVILATNVAETSVTIEGVAAVVDSGLARRAGHDPWSGLPTLRVRPISRAAAVQRAGRAGRTGPGRALRLYTQHDFDTRPAFEIPEVRRNDLSEGLLYLAALGSREPGDLPWLEPPPAEAVRAGRELLARLGALDDSGELTDVGRALVRLPVHPRLARLALAAAHAGAPTDGALLASLLAERDIRRERGAARESGPSDLLTLRDRFLTAAAAGFTPRTLRDLELNPAAVQAVERGRRQLERLLGTKPADTTHAAGIPADDEALLRAVLLAFPDRVAQRVTGRPNELLVSGGGRARLAESSEVRDAPWLVAVDAEEATGGERERLPLVRLASRIEPDWLLALGGPDLAERTEIVWNAAAERVEEVYSLRYGALVLDESTRLDVETERATPVLHAAALAAGPQAFVDPEAFATLAARIAFVRSLGLPEAPEDLDDARLARLVAILCDGRRSFAELRAADPLGAFTAGLPPAARALLARMAPERLELPGGRKLRVAYEAGKPPWVESYLQDFFGLAEGPRVGGGRVPVTLHLLAPSRRPVQVTTDLAGFWERHYPGLRNALARRYPKHAWPDDPRRAKPPPPKGR